MAVYTDLSTDALAAVARRFGLPALDRARPEPRGATNTNHHLWAGGQRFFLRLNEGKSDAEVLFEAEVLRFLSATGFPVPRLHLADDGLPFVRVAGKQAMLFSYAAGEELPRAAAGPERCRSVGAQLGRLHELSGGFPGDRPNPYAPSRVRGWIEALRPDGGGDPEVRAALPVLEEELLRAEALPAAPRGLAHGDLFVENVLWIGDRVSCVLDWEMSCVEAFAWDLGVALNAWCWVDGQGHDAGRARALLDGYGTRRRLDPETADALHAWTRFAALRFAASRIHGFRLARIGPERLTWKDWRGYRDRLLALRALGERGFRERLGL
jgi:homoserine kinase type II